MSACGVRQPGSSDSCERDAGHDGEHQSTLSPFRTFNYWNGDTYPVGYRLGVIAEVERDRIARDAAGSSQAADQ